MSVKMYVRLENVTRPSARLSNFGDLFAEQKSLDRVTKAARVRSLFAFTHGLTEEMGWAYRELGDPDVDAMSDAQRKKFDATLEKTYCQVGKWYAATDGLKTVDALLADRASRGAEEDSVGHTLDELRKVLAKAAKAGQRFRLVGE